MSKMSNLHAVQNDRPEIHGDDFDCDWNSPGERKEETEEEGEARRQRDQDRYDRTRNALYCRIFQGHTVPAPTVPDGYELSSVQIELKASKTTHVIIGESVDDACSAAEVKLDELLVLRAVARPEPGAGRSRTDVIVSTYKRSGIAWAWTEWGCD